MDHQRKRQKKDQVTQSSGKRNNLQYFLVSSLWLPDSLTLLSVLSSFFVRNQKSSSIVVVVALLGNDEHALSSFFSTPPANSLTPSTPLTGIRPFTTVTPLGGESGRMADTGPQTQVMSPTISISVSADFTPILNQMDNFQEKAFFGFSEELAPGRS